MRCHPNHTLDPYILFGSRTWCRRYIYSQALANLPVPVVVVMVMMMVMDPVVVVMVMMVMDPVVVVMMMVMEPGVLAREPPWTPGSQAQAPHQE